MCVCVRREGETFLPLQPLCRRSMLLVISGICCPTLTFALCCHLKSFVLNSLNPHQGVGKHESRRSKRREGRLRSGGGVCACVWRETYSFESKMCAKLHNPALSRTLHTRLFSRVGQQISKLKHNSGRSVGRAHTHFPSRALLSRCSRALTDCSGFHLRARVA